MSLRHRSLPFVLSLLFVPVLAAPLPAQTADEVVEKHLAAVGGRETLGRLTSRRATGVMTVSTPAGDLTGPIEILNKAPNKARAYMRLDLNALGVPEIMVVDQKFDGVNGWALNNIQGDTPITGNQLENMRNAAFPSPLMAYRAAGGRVELKPGAKVGGRDAVVMVWTPSSGSAQWMFFDAETFLLLRTQSTINSPQMGGDVDQTVDYTDYRTVDGVKVPFQVVSSNALQTVTFRFETVEHNVAIDDAVFTVKAPVEPAR